MTFSPFGSSVNHTAGWHPEPSFRGSFSILSSCFITLALCLWTAMHPNIPSHGEKGKTKWEKLGFVIVGIFAPEYISIIFNGEGYERRVVAVAFLQYDNMREIDWKMIRALGQEELEKETAESKRNSSNLRFINPLFWWYRWKKTHGARQAPSPGEGTSNVDPEAGSSPEGAGLERVSLASRPGRDVNKVPRRHLWTKTHSFYVSMGGFVLQRTGGEEGAAKRVVVGIRELDLLCSVDPALVPDISQEEIKDKSKADGLAKLISCWQAFWFCSRCVARVGEGLAISLLELNTVAHCLCAFVVYALWWNKPLNVDEPTVILITPGAEEAHWPAIDQRRLDYLFLYRQRGPRQLVSESAYRFTRRNNAIYANIARSERRRARIPAKQEPTDQRPRSGPTRLFCGDTLHRHSLHHQGCRLQAWLPSFVRSKHFIDLTEEEVGLLQAIEYSEVTSGRYPAQAATDPSGQASALFTAVGSMKHEDYFRWKGAKPTASFATRLNSEDGCKLVVRLGAASMLYGGLHLLAWRAPFHSTREEYIWKVSALTLLAGGGLLLSFIFVDFLDVKIVREPMIEHRPSGSWFSTCKRVVLDAADTSVQLLCLCIYLVILVAALVLGVCFVPARFALAVGSYIDLAYLPPEALPQISWVKYIPHI